MRETIKAAACRWDGVVWWIPAPARHGDIIAMLAFDLFPDEDTLVYPDDQGFITNTGRFVGRVEAAQIAIKAGQIKATQWGDELFSEDLW